MVGVGVMHVARIFDRGAACERSEYASAGVWGRSPQRGVRGAETPRKFLRNMALYTTFGNKDRVLNLLLT